MFFHGFGNRPALPSGEHMLATVRRYEDWTCPDLMDTPKSAKVSAEGVNGGEGRQTEAAEVFG